MTENLQGEVMSRSARRHLKNVIVMPMLNPPASASAPAETSDRAIAERAFELYCARGRQDGHDVEDWLNAERELRGETTSTSA